MYGLIGHSDNRLEDVVSFRLKMAKHFNKCFFDIRCIPLFARVSYFFYTSLNLHVAQNCDQLSFCTPLSSLSRKLMAGTNLKISAF